jgi:hypothetical protein
MQLIALATVVLLVVFWIHTFVILYHLIRFGVGPRPKQVSLIFFIGSFILFMFPVLAILSIIFTP